MKEKYSILRELVTGGPDLVRGSGQISLRKPFKLRSKKSVDMKYMLRVGMVDYSKYV